MTTFSRQARLGLSLAFCCGTLACIQNARAQETIEPQGPPGNWNDTYIGARYSDDFHFPGSAAKVEQKIGFVTTAGGFKYGSYVFNADFLVSDKNNPEVGGTRGAQEVYSVGRVDFSAGRVFGHPVGFGGIVRDVGLTTGYEFSAKNDAFANRARMLVLGPSIQFAVPRGYWNAMIGWRTEKNYNGIVHKDVDYDTAAHGETSWLVPFHLGPAPVTFKGFVSVTGPKGLDGFHTETKTEVLSRMSLLFDVGALAGHARTFYLGPGYEFWHNMFGTPPSEAPGTKRSAATVVGEIHF
jgi:hypothetical protein